MALPFGICDASEAFNMAQDFEEEQEEQNYEEERSCHDEFILRLSPNFRQASVDSRDEKKPWLTVSKLIITTNDVGAAFTDAYLLNQDAALKMGLVSGPYTSCRKGNTVNQTSFWDKSCFLYSFRDQPDVILCQMKQTIDEKFVFDWAEKVRLAWNAHPCWNRCMPAVTYYAHSIILLFCPINVKNSVCHRSVVQQGRIPLWPVCKA